MIESHGFAELYAKDFEAHGHARVALNIHGEPAKSRATTRSTARVVKVESLTGYRTRLTLESGRTMTMPDGRWILADHVVDSATT